MGNSTLPLGGGDATRLSEIILQPGHGFVAGDVIRADENNPGEYLLAQADNAVNAEAVGMVETIAGDSFELVYQGRVDLSTVVWADLPFTLPADQVWFLSEINAGELTKTPPSTAGAVIKAMLVVTSDTGGSEEGILTGYIGVQIGGDNTVNINEIQPVGGIMPWAAPAVTPVPVGWALCDGQAISRTTFVDLFNVIGTDYGVGDGATTFNVPDLQGRFPLGQEPGGDVDFDNVAETGGEKDHTLTATELPDHSHTHDILALTDPALPGPAYTSLVLPPGPPPTPAGTLPGGGTAHNNMPPFLVINYIIRTTEHSSAALLDHSLSDHDDVGDVSSPNDCDLLKFNAGSGEWEATQQNLGVSFRNKIINGNFSIWQRGPQLQAPAGPVAGIVGFASDRWSWQADTDTGTFNPADLGMARGLFLPGEAAAAGIEEDPQQYMRFESVLSGSAGNAGSQLVQRIEKVETFNGRTATLSFWARTESGSGTIALSLFQFFGTGGSTPVTLPASVDIALTTAWTYYTVSFPIPSVSGKTIDYANDSLRVRFHNYIDSALATLFGFVGPINFTGILNITNIQIEEGASATSFEKKSLQEEIGMCQRYFCKNQSIDVIPSAIATGEHFAMTLQFFNDTGQTSWPSTMRSTPTVTIFLITSTGIIARFLSDSHVTWGRTGGSQTSGSWNWTADAEL